MEIIRVREKIYQKFNAPSVALGNFDGVHLGHCEIIQRTIKSAHEKGRDAVVYTFDPHPRLVLGKVPEIPRITTPSERAAILEELGVDVLVLAEFTKDFAALSPEQFMLDVLVEELGTKHLYIGENYRFGRDRTGTAQALKKAAPELGFNVHIVPSVMIGGVVVSSSRIREHLLQGEIREANMLLGREFRIEGRVIHGHHRGKKLGFPTANIKPEVKLHPPEGVYAVYCILDGVRYPGVMNIGYNPTFRDKRVSYEVHIIDFDRDLYGMVLQVYLVQKLRDEKTFSSVDDLRFQIALDVEEGKDILREFI